MMSDVVLALSLQRCYFHKEGSRYLGDRAETLKVRLADFFRTLPNNPVIFFSREIHQTNDSFFMKTQSYALVGTPDIEILEPFKPYPKFIINTTRYSALYRTPLESELSKIRPKTITLVGVETHTNVLYTAEELRNMNYEVIVPEPLVAAEEDYMHAAGISFLSNTLSVRVE